MYSLRFSHKEMTKGKFSLANQSSFYTENLLISLTAIVLSKCVNQVMAMLNRPKEF